MKQLKKVLVILPNLRVCNGVASYMMNYYKNLDHAQIKMDFALISDIPSPYYDDIKKNGDKVIILPSIKNIFAYNRFVRKTISENGYDIIHSNVANNSVFVMKAAKKAGVKSRILHSHATQSSDIKWKKFCNDMLTPLALKRSNIYFACSKLAGDFLFGEREYTVIKNALDIDRFKINTELGTRLKKEMGLENKFVIGTVGRLAYQKNPFFAMDIFSELLKSAPDAMYLWVGSGPLDDKARAYAREKGIDRNMIFTGNRDDVEQLYQAMDVFFLPSLYEGLPVVGIEAQACGLPMVTSDTITRELKVTNNVDFLSLSAPLSQWAECLYKYKDFERTDTHPLIIKNGYEIKDAAKKLQDLYLNL